MGSATEWLDWPRALWAAGASTGAQPAGLVGRELLVSSVFVKTHAFSVYQGKTNNLCELGGHLQLDCYYSVI